MPIPLVVRSLKTLVTATVVVLLAMPAAAAPGDGTLPDGNALSPETVSRAVVGVHAQIPPDARTASTLGTEREGSGVVIGNDGLVLTIGYLILEAEMAEIIVPEGDGPARVLPAAVVAYDHETGFGLLRAVLPLNIAPLPFGNSATLAEGAPAIAVSHTGPRPVTPVTVTSRRTFAGYWEYLLDSAIFTVPPHPLYGGAALIGTDGRLLGIGSLLVNDAAAQPHPLPGNMFVPIDLLKPILGDMVARGRSGQPARPWIGAYTNEAMGRVIVVRVVPAGPADKAGLKSGDIILGVNGEPVGDMADYLRKVRASGEAGVEVRLEVLPLSAQEMTVRRLNVRSSDRHDWLRLQKGY